MSTNKSLVERIYNMLFGGLSGSGTIASVNGLGYIVHRAAAADPQNVQQTIFTIAGGIIGVTGLFGVRTIIQAGGASTMQFRHSVVPTVLDNGTLIITADNVGAIYSLTGDPGDPIASAGAAVAGLAPVFSGKAVPTAGTYGAPILFLCGAGNIQVIMTAAAGTGSTRYALMYVPIDAAATVVAA